MFLLICYIYRGVSHPHPRSHLRRTHTAAAMSSRASWTNYAGKGAKHTTKTTTSTAATTTLIYHGYDL